MTVVQVIHPSRTVGTKYSLQSSPSLNHIIVVDVIIVIMTVVTGDPPISYRGHQVQPAVQPSLNHIIVVECYYCDNDCCPGDPPISYRGHQVEPAVQPSLNHIIVADVVNIVIMTVVQVIHPSRYRGHQVQPAVQALIKSYYCCYRCYCDNDCCPGDPPISYHGYQVQPAVQPSLNHIIVVDVNIVIMTVVVLCVDPPLLNLRTVGTKYSLQSSPH